MHITRCAGIFAAGEGSRLAEAFPGIIKPLVPVAGVPMIEWTVKLLHASGFDDITVLLNTKGKDAREHLKKAFPSAKFVFIIKDTASSYESFRLVSQMLAQKSEDFLLSTVDSLYRPQDIKGIADLCESARLDAVLGVTDKIEDEKPLWADINAKGLIKKIGPDCKDKKYATSGIYMMTTKLAEEMPPAAEFPALRHYLAAIAGNKKIGAVKIPESVDIDDIKDIPLAERFIAEHFSDDKTSEVKHA